MDASTGTIRGTVVMFVLGLCVFQVSGFVLNCHTLCHTMDGQTNSTQFTECNCPNIHGRETTTAPPPTTTTGPATLHRHSTQSVCDYLCSIQEGGSACDCSRPVIPG